MQSLCLIKMNIATVWLFARKNLREGETISHCFLNNKTLLLSFFLLFFLNFRREQQSFLGGGAKVVRGGAPPVKESQRWEHL